MPFSEEEVEGIGLAILETKTIQIYGLVHGRVDTAYVNHELAVDEDPYIIVPCEPKQVFLVGVVRELRVQFECEVEIAIDRANTSALWWHTHRAPNNTKLVNKILRF